MHRLYEASAYAPPKGRFWARTPAPDWTPLSADLRTDVAIVGGGYTGVSTALHLAEAGVEATLLEADDAGFGASGRNGGFCCLGGAKATDAMLRRRHGEQGRRDWRRTERAAVDTVARILDIHGIDADTHSRGETQLAHSPRAMQALRAALPDIRASYGVEPNLIDKAGLRQAGLGGPFHGALTIPIGFALDPARYHAGLSRAAEKAGAALHAQSPVTAITHADGLWRLSTPDGTVSAKRVVIATNGYGAEDVPAWLRGRTLPVLSTVIVTRPLTLAEREAQGWTSRQMSFDTRQLLHYFRLLPDDRFLFGMRGGLSARPRETRATARRIRRDFHAMFPAWRDVEIEHDWSGLVCLTRTLTPFVGPVPDMPGVFAGFGYHGNGVAMATHAGRVLASLVRGAAPDADYPDAIRIPPPRFPLGRFRRSLLRPAYLAAETFDL
ncbi:FAD dependent oxidoreductase [Roseivivax halodurans JCM 10272]|uniref:FAD dependent oxidoreductase n=1 Tax=Roseivivax halodurans JCM 10272 TaxID=1449350 RepID=X7EKS6_9RHOB|nr:FAD-binding oxidoreductase [Roseivivax halodurans]ETX15753.1 FAD dependent oxidoreductase [Roseivivax halodurans JCM 10272]